MEKVTMYKCKYCGELFESKYVCSDHEDRHERIYKANKMLKNGSTLKEIQDECNIWYKVPEHLENVNTENCFVISHLQCCNKPAYQIDYIDMNGKVRLWGCGSWNGYYGSDFELNSMNLKNPHPKEELFVDKRYGSRW